MNWKEFIKRVDWRALLKPLAILVAIVLIFVGGEVVGAARNSNPLAHIDYNLWVAIVIALVALAGLSIQLRQARFAATLDSFWHLENQFIDPVMVEKRREVAWALLNARHSHETDDLLNFFDVMGYLVEREAIDVETIWIMFSDSAFGYWYGASKYVDDHCRTYPLYWDHYRKLITRLLPIEADRRGITQELLVKTLRDDAPAFLKDECRNYEPAPSKTRSEDTQK